MISRMKSWALMALSVVAVLIGAYAMGGRAAIRSADIRINEKRRKAANEARHVESTVNQMADDDVVGRLDSWVRNSKR